MSITSTRKVSGSANLNSRVSKYGSEESFVEHIDTTNNVAVRDESERDQHQQQFESDKEETEKKTINASPTYVTSAIEALAASGVYEISTENLSERHSVGVYDNNQSIVRDEEADNKGRSYLKHFYEKNEILKEIDKFI